MLAIGIAAFGLVLCRVIGKKPRSFVLIVIVPGRAAVVGRIVAGAKHECNGFVGRSVSVKFLV